MKLLPTPEHPIYVRIRSAERMLRDACERFVEVHRGRELSLEQASALLALLGGPNSLVAFNRAVRGLMGHLFGDGRRDSTQFWQIIDATASWEDAHPGRWPYTAEPEWNLYLTWSEELAQAALAGSIH